MLQFTSTNMNWHLQHLHLQSMSSLLRRWDRFKPVASKDARFFTSHLSVTKWRLDVLGPGWSVCRKCSKASKASEAQRSFGREVSLTDHLRWGHVMFFLEPGNPMHEFRNWLGRGLGGRDVSKFQELPTFPQQILGISVESSRFCRFWRPKKFPKKKSFQLDFFFPIL